MHRFILGKRPLPFALFRHYLAITVTRLKKKKKNFKKSKEMRVFASVADKIFHTGATSLSLPYMMT